MHIGDAEPVGPLDAAMTDISELCGRPTRTMTLHHRAPRQIDGSLTANDPRSEQRWQQKVSTPRFLFVVSLLKQVLRAVQRPSIVIELFVSAIRCDNHFTGGIRPDCAMRELAVLLWCEDA